MKAYQVIEGKYLSLVSLDSLTDELSKTLCYGESARLDYGPHIGRLYFNDLSCRSDMLYIIHSDFDFSGCNFVV